MEKKYIITESELRELLHDTLQLEALYSGGVDNWDWYGASIRDYEERNGDIEETIENLLSDYPPFVEYPSPWRGD